MRACVNTKSHVSRLIELFSGEGGIVVLITPLCSSPNAPYVRRFSASDCGGAPADAGGDGGCSPRSLLSPIQTFCSFLVLIVFSVSFLSDLCVCILELSLCQSLYLPLPFGLFHPSLCLFSLLNLNLSFSLGSPLVWPDSPHPFPFFCSFF